MGFHFILPKTRRRESFALQKFQPRSVTTLSVQLNNRQMDPLITFVEKERKSFFEGNWPEKYFWQKLLKRAAQLKSAPSINAKTLVFRSLL